MRRFFFLNLQFFFYFFFFEKHKNWIKGENECNCEFEFNFMGWFSMFGFVLHVFLMFWLHIFFSCGKTTVCQLFSSLSKRKLYSVNCHMHTEAADFLGGLRPVRAKVLNSSNLNVFTDTFLIFIEKNTWIDSEFSSTYGPLKKGYSILSHLLFFSFAFLFLFNCYELILNLYRKIQMTIFLVLFFLSNFIMDFLIIKACIHIQTFEHLKRKANSLWFFLNFYWKILF